MQKCSKSDLAECFLQCLIWDWTVCHAPLCILQGYSRKATALCYLERYEEAKIAYEEAIKLDPDNEQLKKGLEETESKLTGKMISLLPLISLKLTLHQQFYLCIL